MRGFGRYVGVSPGTVAGGTTGTFARRCAQVSGRGAGSPAQAEGVLPLDRAAADVVDGVAQSMMW
jgi:hypothetical protein